jgi:hypothetical protein
MKDEVWGLLSSSFILHPSSFNPTPFRKDFLVRRPGQQDVLLVITSPFGVEDPRGFSPFDAEHPDELVFCCFFKELEQRTGFLDRLRAIAAAPLDADADRAALNDSMAEQYTRLYREGQAGEAFFVAVRWWYSVMRRAYHVYRLKIGFAPYRTSCLVAFRELDPDDLQVNLARALQFMEREKSRVLGFFGLDDFN